ncbi:MAG: glycosyltransferase family 39 protein [Bryobacteraceae bacterium]|nr:glycosyltransferase family 39 protein [Bryobacteraceae bacterium]
MSARRGRDWHPWLAAAFAAAVAALYLDGLGSTGLLGPDEPRYAAIGREMARSGDWATPRLWGEAWFEKPPLLYWMTAAAFRLGLGDHLAPRVPVALLSALFLVFQWAVLRRLLGDRTAWMATLMLAASAGWTAYSFVAVTDLPLAVFFQTAVLLTWFWMENGNRFVLYGAGAALGAAVLAKGLVPVVLALPVLWLARRQWRQWAGPAALAAAVAAPWFAAMLWMHGRAFFDEFILRHHLSRFASDELQHVQPFWFYAPVLLAGLLPWTPAALLAGWRAWKDPRLKIPLWVLVFGFFFFSISRNKLPGYLLPLLPSACILCGAALDRAQQAGRALFWTVMLASLAPAAEEMLPEALLHGIRRTAFSGMRWEPLAVLLPAGLLAWWLDHRERRMAAVAAVAAVAFGAIWHVKRAAAPALDELVSARGLWRRVAPQKDQACILRLHRTWRYGLAYYAGAPLPDCAARPLPVAIDQPPGSLPRLVPLNKAGIAAAGPAVK